MKKTFYTEFAYVLGIIVLAFGTALMKQADFGMSMVVAPAYIIHLKLSQYLPWFSFGMAEYLLQAVLIAATSLIVGGFKKGYIFSFITAVLYGVALDLWIALVSLIPAGGVPVRLALFAVGFVCSAAGVSLFFRSYISPEAYELFVKELSGRFGWEISRVKLVYDCCSCAAGIALSFAFFGLWHFEGVKFGTIFCALANGPLIGLISRLTDAAFSFTDRFALRSFFEN